MLHVAFVQHCAQERVRNVKNDMASRLAHVSRLNSDRRKKRKRKRERQKERERQERKARGTKK